MSLINEALQKVREQNRQQAAGGAVVPFQGALPQRSNPRMGLGLWLGGGVLLVVLFAVGAGVLLVNRRPPPATVVMPVPPPVPTTPPAPAPSVAAPESKPVPVILPVAASPTIAAAPTIEIAPPVEIAPAPVAKPILTETRPPAPPPAVAIQEPVAVTAVAPPALVSPAPAEPAPVVVAPIEKPAPPPAPAVTQVDMRTLEVPNMGTVRLAGLARSSIGARAILNTTIVSVGDRFGEITVTEIEGRGVSLKIDGKTYTLKMP